jgi:CspA family cold shock protein
MNPSVNKRQKERQRQERQKEKAERKKLRQEEKRARPPGPNGEDPDIAGIVPGPQPRSEEELATTTYLGAGEARAKVPFASEEGGLMAEGTIKRLTDKGFGFIETSPGKDIFFHMSAVQGVRFEDLRQGQRVSFTEGMGPKGPKAENVKPI